MGSSSCFVFLDQIAESWSQLFGQEGSRLKAGQLEETKLGLLVLLWEKGELFGVVVLWQVAFGKTAGRSWREQGCWGQAVVHHKLLLANVVGRIYFWTVLPGAGGKQTPPPDPFRHWELSDGCSQVPNRGME